MLGFFPGWARGAIYPGFCYQSEKGAVACPIRFKGGTGSVKGESPQLPSHDRCPTSVDDSTSWTRCRDYSNGGPYFDVNSVGDAAQPSFEVLATYAEFKDRPAAVACSVSFGVAVLCGTHPELHPDWLQPSAGCSEATMQQHTVLHTALLEDHLLRRQFWRRLLHECRLGAYLTPLQGNAKIFANNTPYSLAGSAESV